MCINCHIRFLAFYFSKVHPSIVRSDATQKEVVGALKNGDIKPFVRIRNNQESGTILLGSLAEAKASTVSLSKKSNEGLTFDKPVEDTKAVIKPMLE